MYLLCRYANGDSNKTIVDDFAKEIQNILAADSGNKCLIVVNTYGEHSKGIIDVIESELKKDAHRLNKPMQLEKYDLDAMDQEEPGPGSYVRVCSKSSSVCNQKENIKAFQTKPEVKVCLLALGSATGACIHFEYAGEILFYTGINLTQASHVLFIMPTLDQVNNSLVHFCGHHK